MGLENWKFILAGSALHLSCHQMAVAQTPKVDAPNVISGHAFETDQQSQHSIIDQFSPKPHTDSTQINNTHLDKLLSSLVVDLGPSTRTYQGYPFPKGKRGFVSGHTSPYRLEGNRIKFSFLNDRLAEALSKICEVIQAIGSTHDVSRFSRDEQLAFWFNLHNIAVIEQIALNYPVKPPREIKNELNGVSSAFNDAKFITISNMPLSLRDIREKIVYPNWDDPDVTPTEMP